MRPRAPAFETATSGRVSWLPTDDVVTDHFRQLGGDYLRAIRKLATKPPRRKPRSQGGDDAQAFRAG